MSEMYSRFTLDISVMTFYISIVYFVGRLIRYLTTGLSRNIIITDMPYPDYLINLCEGIYVARMAEMLGRERKLYYELIDVLRSPETLKKITGSSRLKKDQ